MLRKHTLRKHILRSIPPIAGRFRGRSLRFLTEATQVTWQSRLHLLQTRVQIMLARFTDGGRPQQAASPKEEYFPERAPCNDGPT